MLNMNENSTCILDRMNEWNFKVCQNDSTSKDLLKRPISPFLEVGFENLFDSRM